MAEWRPSNFKLDVAINPSASHIVDAGLGDSPARKMELLRVATDMRALEKLSCRR